IILNKKSITLKKGKTLKLKYDIPLNSYASKIIWTSGNKKVVTVSSSGKIKAVKAGFTYIKVKTNNNKTAKCKIKVV
ncbi:MAG: Ig-like domain-containing protein, partial [Lachnospiraceae bacterium]|nr:Ig-like domain-containing protein [Lachnospiraceae bacterium]